MNRKDLIAKLTAQGVDEAEAKTLADSILADHSSVANNLRSERDELAKTVKSMEDEQKGLKEQLDGFEKVQKTNEELQEKLETVESNLTNTSKQHQIYAEVVKSGARNHEIVGKLIDADQVTIGEDGKMEGLEEQLTKLKEAEPSLFQGDVSQVYNPQPNSPTHTPPKPKVESLNDAIAQHYQQAGKDSSNQPNPLNVGGM